MHGQHVVIAEAAVERSALQSGSVDAKKLGVEILRLAPFVDEVAGVQHEVGMRSVDLHAQPILRIVAIPRIAPHRDGVGLPRQLVRLKGSPRQHDVVGDDRIVVIG